MRPAFGPARSEGWRDLVDIVQAVAAWLHSLATVILLGYYALLALVVIPVLRSAVNGPALGRVIPAIERRAAAGPRVDRRLPGDGDVPAVDG